MKHSVEQPVTFYFDMETNGGADGKDMRVISYSIKICFSRDIAATFDEQDTYSFFIYRSLVMEADKLSEYNLPKFLTNHTTQYDASLLARAIADVRSYTVPSAMEHLLTLEICLLNKWCQAYLSTCLAAHSTVSFPDKKRFEREHKDDTTCCICSFLIDLTTDIPNQALTLFQGTKEYVKHLKINSTIPHETYQSDLKSCLELVKYLERIQELNDTNPDTPLDELRTIDSAVAKYIESAKCASIAEYMTKIETFKQKRKKDEWTTVLENMIAYEYLETMKMLPSPELLSDVVK